MGLNKNESRYKMKDLLEKVRNNYKELQGKLEIAKADELEANQEREKLALEFKMQDDALEEINNHFERIENRITDRKKKYVKRSLLTHPKTLINMGLGTATLGTIIGMVAGTITNPLFLPIFATFYLGGLVDLKASWKNMKKLGESKFENLASTQRSRDVADRAYVIKLQREKELRETQGKIIDNTKKLNQAVAKRKSIEAEIIDVKLNAFDEFIDEKTAAQTLTLK